MIITLKRIAKRTHYTIGRMFIDGVYFCDTLEPGAIELKTSVSIEKVMESLKVAMPHKPFAIPEGTYKVSLTYSPRFNRLLPLLSGDKKFNTIFQGIRIHAGNDPKDTQGCILVGENKIKGKVINSLSHLNKLIDKLQRAENSVSLEIL